MDRGDESLGLSVNDSCRRVSLDIQQSGSLCGSTPTPRTRGGSFLDRAGLPARRLSRGMTSG
eukprot:4869131-Prymnesium_polylepis.1